jgi:hypothetical protein
MQAQAQQERSKSNWRQKTRTELSAFAWRARYWIVENKSTRWALLGFSAALVVLVAKASLNYHARTHSDAIGKAFAIGSGALMLGVVAFAAMVGLTIRRRDRATPEKIAIEQRIAEVRGLAKAKEEAKELELAVTSVAKAPDAPQETDATTAASSPPRRKPARL